MDIRMTAALVGVIGGLASCSVQATDGWSVTVTPYVWATSFAGNIAVLGQSASFAEPFAAGVPRAGLRSAGTP
jgi:hypothetical protein